MTEAEWQAAVARHSLLTVQLREASLRKQILFCSACCRRIWDQLIDDRSRAVVELAELVADGAAPSILLDALGRAEDARHTIRQTANHSRGGRAGYSDSTTTAVCHAAEAACSLGLFASGVEEPRARPPVIATGAANAVRYAAITGLDPRSEGEANGPIALAAKAEEEAAQVALFREVIADPDHPVTFDPAWRTTDVMLLARGIYDERAFDRMPILADALQDAGCDSEGILTHCRDAQQVHVRGCWVLDQVLGRK